MSLKNVDKFLRRLDFVPDAVEPGVLEYEGLDKNDLDDMVSEFSKQGYRIKRSKNRKMCLVQKARAEYVIEIKKGTITIYEGLDPGNTFAKRLTSAAREFTLGPNTKEVTREVEGNVCSLTFKGSDESVGLEDFTRLLKDITKTYPKAHSVAMQNNGKRSWIVTFNMG